MSKVAETKNLIVEDSLTNLADSIVIQMEKVLRQSKSEEDLRIGVDKILEPVLNASIYCKSRKKVWVIKGMKGRNYIDQAMPLER